MAPIGIAIAGGGIFAKEQHIPAILAASDLLSLKAIYSRSLKSAKDAASQSATAPDVYSDDSGEGKSFKDLLARKDITAIIMALPIMSQPKYIEEALAAGKHVFAEKPVAADLARGKKLIEYSKVSATNGATFAIAENFRFLPTVVYAKEEGKKLGKIIGFNAKVFTFVKQGGKYIETEWRKKPEYQGGFLLDGGVHSAAILRTLLGKEAAIDRVVAYSNLAQEHLPPIDSFDASIKTKSGAVGSFSLHYGTTLTANDFAIAYEHGTVTIASQKVTVVRTDDDEPQTHVKEFEYSNGVKEEVKAWAESLIAGKPNPLQSPQEALADLEVLEKIFKSGEQDGAQQKLELQ